MATKKYDDVKFALAENLTGKPKEVAEANGIKEGLVIVGVKYASPGEWDVLEVKGSPTEFVNKLAKEEGLDLGKLFMFEEKD